MVGAVVRNMLAFFCLCCAVGGAHVHYADFPQYGHGDMIRVLLEHALDRRE